MMVSLDSNNEFEQALYQVHCSRAAYHEDPRSYLSNNDIAVDSVLDKIIDLLHTYDAHNCKIWITGHSLGGALAVITGKKLLGCFEQDQNGLSKPHRIFTFGSPKVGNSVFAERCPLKDNIRQFINNDDIIPYMPPFIGWNYTHINNGWHYQLTREGWKHIRIIPSVSKKLMREAKKLWPQMRSIVGTSKGTHSIDIYVEYLEANLERGPVAT